MLLKPLLRNAAERGSSPAIFDDFGQMTWADIASKAKKLAKIIRFKTKQERVGILLPTSGAFAVGFYATLLAGKVAVPFNFLLGEKETEHILSDSGIDLVLSVQKLLDNVDAGAVVKRAAEAGRIGLMDLQKMSPSLGTVLPQLLPLKTPDYGEDDLAAVLYTSGTSGLPKGVELTHGNLDSDVHSAIERAELDRAGEQHVFLSPIPLFHSTGLLATMLCPMQLSAKMIYIARFSPAKIIEGLREHHVTVMAAVPSMYQAIARTKSAKPEDFSHMYMAISGGEPLPARIRTLFKDRFHTDLMEGYGLTETCGPISVNSPPSHRPGSVGKLLPAATASIRDDDGNEVPTGETGEVWMKGPMIFKQYSGLPDATAEAKTSEGFFKSGDLGHIDEDGYLFITGRKKDMIIVSGENVYPREIEEMITEMPEVEEAAVIGRADKSRGEVPVAYVIAAEGQEASAEAIRQHCKERGLPQFKIPKDFIVTDDLPRSPTGKVLKRELLERDKARAS